MAYPTITRPTLVLDGSSSLSRSSGLGLVTGQSIYVGLWLRPASTAVGGRTVIKHGTIPNWSFALFHSDNNALSVAITADGTTFLSMVSSNNSFMPNVWHWVEFQVTASSLSLAITPQASASVSPWTTIAHVGGIFGPGVSVPFVVGDSPAVNAFIGQLAGLVILDRSPDITERISLFADGSGRRYWEMRADTRQSLRAAWEFAGSGVDSSPAGRLLDLSSGTPTYSTRSVTILSENLLAAPLRKVADLVASTVAFQFAAGVPSEAAARDRVHIEAEYETDSLARPFALVMLDQSSSSEMTRTVGSRVALRLEAPQDGASDTEASRLQFLHWAGTVFQQMVENSTLGGRPILRIASIEEALGVSNADETDLSQPCFATQIVFDVGVGA